MKIILQHDECDCGAACLCMVAAYHGYKMSISKSRELTRTDSTGTNLYGIVDGAEKIGLNATALSGTMEELLESIEKGEVSFPFVAHTISQSGMLHFVVVTGFRNHKILVADPAVGKRTLAMEEFAKEWTGSIAAFRKGEKFQKGNFTKSNLLKFLALMKGYRRGYLEVLFLSLFTAGIGIIGAFVFQIVIDGLNGETIYAVKLNGIFTALICLYALQMAVQYIRGKLMILLSQRVDVKISMAFYRHLMKLPVSSIALRQTGDYLSRLSDTETIRQAISGASIAVALDSVMVLGCGWILFQKNQKLFGIAFGMVCIYILIAGLYHKPIESSNRKAMEKKAAFQSFFKESVDGIAFEKAFGCVEIILKKAESKFAELADAMIHGGKIEMLFDLLTGNVELIGTVVILWYGFSMVLEGEMTVGSLMTFYALLAYFTEPIKNLAELQPMLQTALVAADRLSDVLELQEENDIAGEKMEHIKSVKFENVDFRYGNHALTLEDVTLEVKKGEKIAVVGRSGSGKTSLARLLLHFYEAENGKILINGKEIQSLQTASLRRKIAYVAQEEFFFADSVINNLTLGSRNVSKEEIEEACRVSGAEEIIEELPFGYETPLNEGGKNLSGGQRQKLALARVLLRKPEFLILDEATSHMDAVAEKAFWVNVGKYRQEMGMIVIAHRLSVVKDCDRIFVMEKGRIAEEGTHEELLKKNGIYQELWDSQL